MTYDELITFYGDAPKAAKGIGVSRQLLYYWRENGIPVGRQALIQIQTRNKLRCDRPEVVPHVSSQDAA